MPYLDDALATQVTDAHRQAAEDAAAHGTTPTQAAQGDVSVGNAQRPDVPHPAYHRMERRWRRCRDLMMGSDAIRDGEDAYLPRFDEETAESYATRLRLAALAPGFARTVSAAVGMLLQQEPDLGDDMPAQLVELWENVDAAGMHGAVFTRLLTMDGVIDGHAGILVDYPRVENPGGTSAADEAARGLRPYWVLFRAEDVYLQHYETVNGVRTLTLLVLRELGEERVGPFGVTPVTRYRIYTNEAGVISCEVWRTPKGVIGGVPTVEIEKATMRNVTKIPFAPFLAGQRLGPNETRPPLLDLADLCIEHHQIKTGMLHLEQLAFVPTVVRTGYIAPADALGNPDPAPVVLGPRSVIDVPINGKVEWLTPTVDVLAPAERSLANNEAAQGAAGLAFLAPETRHAETAAAKRIDAAAQNATLATVGRNLQDTLEEAFGYTGDFLKIAAGSVSVNTDFENTAMDPAMVTALGALATNGKLSIDTLLALLENGQVIPDGFDRAGELKRILTENALPPSPAPPYQNALPLPDNTPPVP